MTAKIEDVDLGSENSPISIEKLLRLQETGLDAANVGVVIADRSFSELPIIYANPAFQRLTGRGGTASLREILAEGECETDEPSIRSAIAEGRSLAFVTKVVGADGLSNWRDMTLASLESSETRLLVGILNDITEQRRIAAELRRIGARLEERVEERTSALERINQDLEGFTYSVSHDLRAPLRAIMGFSKMLVEDHGREVDADMRQTLDRINAAAARMTTIIEDLLTFSRLGRKEMVQQPVHLSEMAEAIASDLTRRHPDRTTRFEIDRGGVTQGDPTLIRMALENLLDNAYKFTSKTEGGLVEFRVLGENRWGVLDNGAGFDERYADKLFRPFERLHSASDFPGTGIGLANVRRIIERHGGKIWAEGVPNQGAKFYFELP